MSAHKEVVEEIDNLIDFAREIVRIPSFTGRERQIANVIYEKLNNIGLDDCWIDGIGNVVGVIKGKGVGPNILLNGHMDIVPEGQPEDWKYDPFSAYLDGEGVIHGRGTADMKGGLASLVYTVIILKRLIDKGKIEVPGDLIFSAVVYEEAAEMFGMEFLCQNTLPERGLSFDLCLLAEPTGGLINLGHRGKIEIVVTTYGKSCHSSRPWQGINALEKALPILTSIFKEISPNLPRHPQLGPCSITVTDLKCKPGALSIVPDVCEISIDRRYLPDQNLDDVLLEISSLVEELSKQDKELNAVVNKRIIREESYTGYTKDVIKHHPVWLMDQDNIFVQRVQKALLAIGQNVKCGYFTGGVDGAFTASVLGIPTIGFSWADEALAHSVNEFTTIENLMKDTEAYLAILCELYDLSYL